MIARMTRIQFDCKANGFIPAELPELPEFLKIAPNCFALAAHYTLTETDVKMGKDGAGEDYDCEVGQVIECGQWTPRNTPRKGYVKSTAKRIPSERDTCILEGKNGVFNNQTGKMEADKTRLDALQAYYAKQKSLDAFGNETYEGESPFLITLEEMAEGVSKAAVGVMFEEHNNNELEGVA